jgi:hypothetical protein
MAMTLASGDYRAVEEKVVATLLYDTGTGGLRDPSDFAVHTVKAADEETQAALGAADFPAVFVRVTGKSETPRFPARSLLKSFDLKIAVLCRGLDRAALQDRAREIAARIEKVVRAENAADRQFQGLPDFIDGGEGSLAAVPTETVFPPAVATTDRVTARAEVRAVLMVPCAIAYE